MENGTVPIPNTPPVSPEINSNASVNFPKPNRTPVFVGGAVLGLVLVAGAWFFISTKKEVPNPCLTQDLSKSAEDNITNVVRSFEEYQSVKDGKALSACKSVSFTSDLMSQSDPFPFYGITTYLVGNPVPISAQEFSVNVNERRMLYSGGVSGGTYPEQDVDATFIVEKDANGRWLIISYNKRNSNAPIGTSTVPEDWKTYRNDKNGFEFKYPWEWVNRDNSLQFGTPNYSSAAFRVIFSEDPTGQLIQDWLKSSDEFNQTAYEGQSSKMVLSSKRALIDGKQAVERQETWNAAGFSTVVTYVKVGAVVYQFSILPGKENIISESDKQKYYKILSTFKFTK